MDDLIEHWRNYRPNTNNFSHQEDWPFFEAAPDGVQTTRQDFSSIINSDRFHMHSDLRADLSLRPVPYIGDIKNAKAIIFLLNPGYCYGDHFAESHCPRFVEALERNLEQNFETEKFPLFYLNPEFSWHDGFAWWERKLGGVAVKLNEELNLGGYRHALQFVSKYVASIELFPYRSRTFKASKFLKTLPSVVKARETFECLAGKNQHHRPALIVARGAAQGKWGVEQDIEKPDNKIVIYRDAKQARGASLSLNSDGGALIYKTLISLPKNEISDFMESL